MYILLMPKVCDHGNPKVHKDCRRFVHNLWLKRFRKVTDLPLRHQADIFKRFISYSCRTHCSAAQASGALKRELDVPEGEKLSFCLEDERRRTFCLVK